MECYSFKYVLLLFAIAEIYNWFTEVVQHALANQSADALFSPNQMQNQNNRVLARSAFPAHFTSYTF